MDFNKLDDTEFPNLDTVDVYAFKNDYDYRRFDNAQMTIHICNVPWDMGEAHVGQRTITGIGNVVKFDDDDARDAWFASKRYAKTPQQWASGGYDGFEWVTKYREFFNGEEIKIPLPFDVVSRFNYCWIEYEPAASDDHPVDYEHGGILKWFWFIRNFQMLSVNATSATVKRDTWTTYINHIDFKGFYLEQGHYPVAKSNVEQYLANPISNNSGLLEPDVSFGELAKVSHSSSVVLNGSDMLAVIVASGNPGADWGTKAAGTWNAPSGNRQLEGQPSLFAFAMQASSLNAFLYRCNANTPQFVKCVKCVFFVSSNLVDIGSTFVFNGTDCSWISGKRADFSLISLAKSQFGYPSRYAHLAKLYTYPYAALELVDDKGDAVQVRIEDTEGSISLVATSSMAYPWLSIDGRLTGIGGSAGGSLTFRNVNAHSFEFGGKWYEHLRRWDIPTFAVLQSAADSNDYSTHFDRAQSALAAANDNANAKTASAAVKANADATADMSITNTAVQVATNNSINNTTNQAIVQGTITDQNFNFASNNLANSVTNETTNNEVDAAYNSAAISGIGGVLSSAASGAATGIALGPVGALGGAVAGAVGGVIGGISGQMQTAVSNNLLETQAAVQMRANTASTTLTNSTSGTKTGQQTSLNSDTNNLQNTNSTTQTANNAGLMKANAAREKAAADTIADVNLSTANNAIANQVKQAALDAPSEFGEFSNGETAATRPMAMFANVLTQSKDAIERTGDWFLRYGYAYNRYIEFQDFNLMPRFTYWKCSDIWVDGLDMSDEHMDEIRFFLMGGVTVWRKPEYIGKTSIYDNI